MNYDVGRLIAVFNSANITVSGAESRTSLAVDLWIIFLVFGIAIVLPFLVRGFRYVGGWIKCGFKHVSDWIIWGLKHIIGRAKYKFGKFNEHVAILLKRKILANSKCRNLLDKHYSSRNKKIHRKNIKNKNRVVGEEFNLKVAFKNIDRMSDLEKKIEEIDKLYNDTENEAFFKEGIVFSRKTELLNKLSSNNKMKDCINALLLAALAAFISTFLGGEILGQKIGSLEKTEQNILMVMLVSLIGLSAAIIVINVLNSDEKKTDQIKKYELDYIGEVIASRKKSYSSGSKEDKTLSLT